MKIILSMLFCILFGWSGVAWADTVTLLWTQTDTTVTAQSIETRGEGVSTWTIIPATSVVITCSAGTCTGVIANAPSSGTTLYRVTSVNAIGTTTRFNAGGWYCGNCAPPVAVTKIGIQ